MIVKVTPDFISKAAVPYWRAKVAHIIADALMSRMTVELNKDQLNITIADPSSWDVLVYDAIEQAKDPIEAT